MRYTTSSKQYTYHVIWSAEDNEYVGLCAEFPSLSWLDEEQSKAYSGIVDLVGKASCAAHHITPVAAGSHHLVA